jgi:hypothetical protein
MPPLPRWPGSGGAVTLEVPVPLSHLLREPAERLAREFHDRISRYTWERTSPDIQRLWVDAALSLLSDGVVEIGTAL